MKKSLVVIAAIAILVGITVIASIGNFFDTTITQNDIKNTDTTRPNFVVIMTDDLDVGTLQKMRDLDLMPNLQKFVINQGTEFNNSFVTNSICCPSRATFLTGQYSHNHGVLTNTYGAKLNDNHTIATWLNKTGYHTGLVGKYLNDYGKKINDNYIPRGWKWFNAIL